MNLECYNNKNEKERKSCNNYIKTENELQIEAVSSACSYGEIFILKSEENNSSTWWINCNICLNKFTNFEIFYNHAINNHLNKESDIIFKTENQNIYNEISNNYYKDSINNISDYAEGVTRSLNDNEFIEDNKLKEHDIPDSDSENIGAIETESLESIEFKKGKQARGILPRHCEKCNKTFKKPSSLRRHISVHLKNENKIYECKICNAKFLKEQKRLYRNHREHAHKDKLPCTICEKTFSSKSNLKNHMLMHRGIKDFKCSQCSSAFCSKARLSDHIRKSHLSAKVPCQFCDKLLSSNNALKIHLRIHTGEKPYVCEQCGNAFQTSSLLQFHIKRHNNDRRYECDVCGKKFLNNTYLRDHKVIHTDAKPYGCEICTARFNSAPALRKHKKLHSGVKKYHCKICGKAYAQSPGLYAHMKSHNIANGNL